MASDEHHKINFNIKSRKGARGIRIAVNGDGSVVVTKPSRVPRVLTEAFVNSKMDWIITQIREVEKRPKKLFSHYSAKDFKEHKQNAYLLAHNRVLYFNTFYKHEVRNITIRNQKTRWGSCSGKGNLSFNYKIVFLPKELQDYLIVHELCHLKEMNHSVRFWNLVQEHIPEYRKLRQKIKIY